MGPQRLRSRASSAERTSSTDQRPAPARSKVPVIERMSQPVDAGIVEELYDLIPDFRRAYDEDGMAPSEFDHYGATARTLRTFIEHYHELQGIVRDAMIPNPDKG